MPGFLNSFLFASYTGPFDLVAGATWGISFRKLKASYSGPCIQVRRLSDNATQNIGFVDNFVDTAAILAFCTDQTGEIAIWYDQSGNDNHFYGADVGFSPIICQVGTIKTNTYNGQVSAYCPDVTHTKIAGSINITNSTIWSVCLQSSEIYRYFFKSATTSFAASTYYNNVTNRVLLENNSFAIGNGTTVPINAPMIFQVQYAGSSSFYNVNGAAGGALSPANPGTGTIGQLSIGYGWTSIDYNQEFIGYGDVLSGGQIATLQNNINTYYGVY